MYREVDFTSHDMKADCSNNSVSKGGAGDGNLRLRGRGEDGGIVSISYGEHILKRLLVVVEDWDVLVIDSGSSVRTQRAGQARLAVAANIATSIDRRGAV